jgi:hypothetical protein
MCASPVAASHDPSPLFQVLKQRSGNALAMVAWVAIANVEAHNPQGPALGSQKAFEFVVAERLELPEKATSKSRVRIDTVATRLRAGPTNRLGQFPGGEVHLPDQTIPIPCEDQATADRAHLSAKELLNRVGGRARFWRRQVLPPQRRRPELVMHNEALTHGTDVEGAPFTVDGD